MLATLFVAPAPRAWAEPGSLESVESDHHAVAKPGELPAAHAGRAEERPGEPPALKRLPRASTLEGRSPGAARQNAAACGAVAVRDQREQIRAARCQRAHAADGDAG